MWTLYIWLFFGAVLQAAPLKFMVVYGIKPDIILILVVYMSLFHGATTGMVTGLVMGLVEDMLSGGLVGLFALSKPLMGYISGMSSMQMVRNNPVNQFISVGVVSLLEGLVVWVILLISRLQQPDPVQALLHTILPQALYNAVLAPMVMLLVEKGDVSVRGKRYPVRYKI